MDTTIIAGIIGFIGAVLGGIITFWGVRYTIVNQEKNKRIERLPLMINNAWKIQKKLSFINWLGYEISKGKDLNESKMLSDFYNEHDEKLTEIAATVSADIYQIINRFFTHISDYDGWKGRNKQKEWFDKADSYFNEVAKLIQIYEDEYKKIDKAS